MEDILKQILAGQKELFESHKELVAGQRQLFAGQKQLFDGQKELFASHRELVTGQKELFEGQRRLLLRVEKIDDNVAGVKQKVDDIKGQQDEDTRLISALMHRTEKLDAKFDGLLHNTLTKDAIADLATKEDIASLDAKFEVLNSRIFHQEAELFRIKAVK